MKSGILPVRLLSAAHLKAGIVNIPVGFLKRQICPSKYWEAREGACDREILHCIQVLQFCKRQWYWTTNTSTIEITTQGNNILFREKNKATERTTNN